MKLPLCYYGNPVLRKKSTTIAEITDEIKKLVTDLIETFDTGNGIGISAVQIGKPIRLFVLRRYIHTSEDEWTVSEPIVYINPKILEYSEEIWSNEEGCLSIPKIRFPVIRPLKIKVESTKLDGTTVIEELEGINARVILHENDHLNGVLFIDRVDPKLLKEAEEKLREIKKRYS